jgi:hypothetical protein
MLSLQTDACIKTHTRVFPTCTSFCRLVRVFLLSLQTCACIKTRTSRQKTRTIFHFSVTSRTRQKKLLPTIFTPLRGDITIPSG